MLTAEYSSPTNEAFSVSKPLPSLADTTDSKTQYLSALREAVSQTQDSINKELTARMEEDKAKAGGVTSTVDEKEEENYGEEVQEED